MSLRAEKKRQVREDILDAARELIEQRGYDNATMREIAGAARVSYQTLYNYFPTKAAILAAVLDDVIAQTAASIEALIDSYDGRLLETLNAINRARLDLISRRERALWRAISAERPHEQGAGGTRHRLNDPAGDSLERLLAMAKGQGQLAPEVDVQLLGDALKALGESAVARYLDAATTSRRAVAETLGAHTALLVTPYLRPAQ